MLLLLVSNGVSGAISDLKWRHLVTSISVTILMEEMPNQNQEKIPTEYQELEGAFAHLRSTEDEDAVGNAYLTLLDAVERGLDVSKYRAEFPELAKVARVGQVRSTLWQLEDDVKRLEEDIKQGKAFSFGQGDHRVRKALINAAAAGADTTEFENRFLELQKRVDRVSTS